MAFAQIELGLTTDQFWRLTPARFWALRTAKTEQIKREDYRAGIVTATIRRALGSKTAEPFDDFPQHKKRRSLDKVKDARAAWLEYKKAQG